MKNNRFCRLTVGLLLMLLITPASQALAETAPIQQVAEKNSNAAYTKIGFALMKETIGFLSVGISDSIVLMQLGVPEKKSDARIWSADGMEHQSWSYPTKGIELGMIQKEGKQTVAGIYVKSPCDYKTQRGIQIGSNAIEVHAAYKTEINPQSSNPESTIVAGTVYGGIIFGLKDDIVSSIFIGASTE